MKECRTLTKGEPCGLESVPSPACGAAERNPERVLENTREPCGGDRTKRRQGFRQKHNPFMAQSGKAGELVRDTQAPMEQKKYLKFKMILLLLAVAIQQCLEFIGEVESEA